jgi:uncharacterized protein YndB with AHSA1/START domain
MRWIIAGAGVLIVLAVLAIAAGYLVPRTRITARTTVLPAAPQQVWAMLTAMGSYPRWRRGVRWVRSLPALDERPAWREGRWHGAIDCQADEVTPPHRFVVRITDRRLSYAGTWTFELSQENAATRLTITEHGEIADPRCRLLARYVFGYAASLDAYLAALTAQLARGNSLRLDSRPQGA